MQIIDPLRERLLRACVGACTCGSKSPSSEWHDQMCHFRLFNEAGRELATNEGRQQSTMAARKILGIASDHDSRVYVGFGDDVT